MQTQDVLGLHKINYKVRAIINSFYYVTGKEGPVTWCFVTVT